MTLSEHSCFHFGNRKTGEGEPVFIIAEIGTGHNGDLVKAGEMIAAAAEAGADCVKFQYVIAEEIIHPLTGNVKLPGGDTPLFERFRALERPPEFYSELKSAAEKHKLTFLCSPFGLESASALLAIGVDAVKIASPELNHFPLLERTGHIPAVLSTGVSTLGDIERALAFRESDTAILHCITSYPAPEEEYNLKLVSVLGGIFGLTSGISDHSRDPVLVPVLSAAAGASIIEKHFTLSNAGIGLDDPVALNPENFTLMCRSVRDSENKNTDKTVEIMEKEFGRERVRRIMGNGIKKLAPSEKDSYRTTNRSVMALKSIKKGELLTTDNTALLRSEKQLKPGVPPELYGKLLGRPASRNILSGEGISWDCF